MCACFVNCFFLEACCAPFHRNNIIPFFFPFDQCVFGRPQGQTPLEEYNFSNRKRENNVIHNKRETTNTHKRRQHTKTNTHTRCPHMYQQPTHKEKLCFMFAFCWKPLFLFKPEKVEDQQDETSERNDIQEGTRKPLVRN